MSHVEASVLFFCEASHHKAPQLRWKKTTGGVHGITRCKAGAGLPRWKALSLNAAPAWISHCVCTLGIHNESKQGHGKSKEAKLTVVCYSPQSLAEACASHLGHPRSIALIWFSQQADSTCVSCISIFLCLELSHLCHLRLLFVLEALLLTRSGSRRGPATGRSAPRRPP